MGERDKIGATHPFPMGVSPLDIMSEDLSYLIHEYLAHLYSLLEDIPLYKPRVFISFISLLINV